jgi:hypothetical protein
LKPYDRAASPMLSDMPASPSPSVVTEDTASWQGYLAKGFGGHHASTTHLYMPLLSCPCCLFRTTMTSILGAADVCGWNFTAQHADAAPGGFPSLQIHQYASLPSRSTAACSMRYAVFHIAELTHRASRERIDSWPASEPSACRMPTCTYPLNPATLLIANA